MWFVALLIAASLGYCVVSLWLPADQGESPWRHALYGSLGIGLGIGLSSCLYFPLLVAGVSKLPVIAGCELVALCATSALVLRRRSATSSAKSNALSPPYTWNWVTALGLAAMLALFVAGFANLSGLNPQGGWDAFAIWNLRARYLLHSETWKYAVTTLPVGTHMEYPLLLSSAIARGWQYSGDTAQIVPIAIAFLFSLPLVILLVSALALERRTSLGLLAGLVLLANPAFLDQAASQYADLPLAFFVLAALVLITLHAEASASRYLSLAGVFAGLATWTKNEGMLLLAALATAVFADTWRSAGLRPAARRCATFLLGALPVLSLTLWFKLAVAPHDPLAGQMGTSLAHKLANPGRWFHVAAGFLQHAWDFAIPLVLLAGAAALLRLRPRDARSTPPWIAVIIVFTGYVLVFVLTPDDLDWLLGTALDRLYTQLWPALVLAVFLSLRCPEDFALVTAAFGNIGKSRKAR
jgi:Dolichyl-phosphate-mannose-protein mannosyltransferase